MSFHPPSLWQPYRLLLLQNLIQHLAFLNLTGDPLTYITANTEPHMETAVGHRSLRQAARPETHFVFNYRLRKKIINHYHPWVIPGILNKSISKGHLCRTSLSCYEKATSSQAYICDAMYIGWSTVWEAGKTELSGRWEKTESRWDVPRRQPLLHPSNNAQHPKTYTSQHYST